MPVPRCGTLRRGRHDLSRASATPRTSSTGRAGSFSETSGNASSAQANGSSTSPRYAYSCSATDRASGQRRVVGPCPLMRQPRRSANAASDSRPAFVLLGAAQLEVGVLGDLQEPLCMTAWQVMCLPGGRHSLGGKLRARSAATSTACRTGSDRSGRVNGRRVRGQRAGDIGRAEHTSGVLGGERSRKDREPGESCALVFCRDAIRAIRETAASV